jgi:hypothetical protein
MQKVKVLDYLEEVDVDMRKNFLQQLKLEGVFLLCEEQDVTFLDGVLEKVRQKSFT